MKFSAMFLRQLHWLNLPAALLLTLLHRTPVLRVAAQVGEIIHASPVGTVLRSTVAAAATLGAMHSLAGASPTSPLVVSVGNPVRGTVGTPLTFGFSIIGTLTPPTSFTFDGPLPPGLASLPAQQGNVIRSQSPVITGTPTQAGTYQYVLLASDGLYSQTDPLTIIITGGVVVAPTITTQPVSQTVNAGGTATFTVVAAGATSYQWRKDGADLAAATAATLALNNVTPANAGVYSVVAQNSAGSAVSLNATLTVNSAPAAPAITTQPASQFSVVGGLATFTVVATGFPSPTYQWLKNSVPITGAVGASLTLSNLTLADAGNYVVNVTNSLGTVTSAAATLNVDAARIAPIITSQPPAGLGLVVGQSLALNVAAAGSGLVYQWRRTAGAVTTDVLGATSPTLSLRPLTLADAGTYFCNVTNSGGTVASSGTIVTVAAASANPGRLVNLSVSTALATPGDSFSLGYVVSGATPANRKPLVVRAGGPALAAFGVSGTLSDPKLELFAGSTKNGENDDWGGSATVATAMAEVGAFVFAPTSRDAALVSEATSRDNSVKISAGASAPNGTGAVIAEIYDATPSASFNATTTPRLINLSVRKDVGASVTMGFVIGGSTAKTMLVRAVGPSLAVFGVAGALLDPKLELFDRTGKSLAFNDNWGGTAALSGAFSDTGAFGLNAGSADAALLITLAPGNYTAQVTVATGTTGIALVEVYEVP
ncbi:MAG: immunoglobulin domain-containing protein [Verrucomicrobia bacterium]|nr:immunoglobulin domain-containing protein [Verrucomicrobiota bacterium]